MGRQCTSRPKLHHRRYHRLARTPVLGRKPNSSRMRLRRRSALAFPTLHPRPSAAPAPQAAHDHVSGSAPAPRSGRVASRRMIVLAAHSCRTLGGPTALQAQLGVLRVLVLAPGTRPPEPPSGSGGSDRWPELSLTDRVKDALRGDCRPPRLARSARRPLMCTVAAGPWGGRRLSLADSVRGPEAT